MGKKDVTDIICQLKNTAVKFGMFYKNISFSHLFISPTHTYQTIINRIITFYFIKNCNKKI